MKQLSTLRLRTVMHVGLVAVLSACASNAANDCRISDIDQSYRPGLEDQIVEYGYQVLDNPNVLGSHFFVGEGPQEFVGELMYIEDDEDLYSIVLFPSGVYFGQDRERLASLVQRFEEYVLRLTADNCPENLLLIATFLGTSNNNDPQQGFYHGEFYYSLANQYADFPTERGYIGREEIAILRAGYMYEKIAYLFDRLHVPHRLVFAGRYVGEASESYDAPAALALFTLVSAD